MMRLPTPVLVAVMSIFASGAGHLPGQEVVGPSPFARADAHFEQNATDGDMEVVFAVKAGDKGLTKLVVLSPDGRKVVDFSAPDASTLGIRQFRFETPEPGETAALKAAYPEGIYRFSGATADGDQFEGESALSHFLPVTTSVSSPPLESAAAPVDNLVISWVAVENVTAYIVELTQDELGVNITARVPGNATTFAVPEGFLMPGKEYQLGIATISDEGNLSFVEINFKTAHAD